MTPLEISRRQIVVQELPFEVSLKQINKAVGYIAFFLPFALLLVGALTNTCAKGGGLDSLSHYFYTRIGGNIFVAALSVIGILLLVFFTKPGAVNGYLNHRPLDMVLAKVAGAAAFVIAFVPTAGTGCALSGDAMRAYVLTGPDFGPLPGGVHDATGARIAFDFWAAWGIDNAFLGQLHNIGAAVMFAILGYFSFVVFARVQSPEALTAEAEPTRKKRMRNGVYRILGLLIFAAIGLLAAKNLLFSDAARLRWDAGNWTFWTEAIALWAFGASWLIKGRFWRGLEDNQP